MDSLCFFFLLQNEEVAGILIIIFNLHIKGVFRSVNSNIAHLNFASVCVCVCVVVVHGLSHKDTTQYIRTKIKGININSSLLFYCCIEMSVF